MQINQIMSHNPVCCSPDDLLPEVARLMTEHHCGAIPVVDKRADQEHRIIGIITDRDIVCRIVAEGLDPRVTRVKECMSHPVATIKETESVEAGYGVMKRLQVRRVPVINKEGDCVGIVTQAHMARYLPENETGQLVKQISQKTESASRMPDKVQPSISIDS